MEKPQQETSPTPKHFFRSREKERTGDKVTNQSPKPGKPYPIGIRTETEI